MEKEVYILIDTNVLVQCCLLELEQGEDLSVLQKLNSLLSSDKFKILLPEVVELEFYNQLDKKTKKLKNHIGEYKKAINTDGNLDEKVKSDMIEKIGECFDERKENTEKVKKEIEKIFSNKNTIKLKITPESLVGAVKTYLSGEKPYNEGLKLSIQPDTLIIELAKDFLSSKNNFKFYLCSKNIYDFAKNPNRNASKMEVLDNIKKTFSHIEYYTNLLQLLNDAFKTGFSEESVKDFERKNTIRKNININLPSNSNKNLLRGLSDLLSAYSSGPTKIFITMNGSRLETPYSLLGNDEVYHDLNKKVNKLLKEFSGSETINIEPVPF